MSKHEEEQVTRLIEAVYRYCGKGLPKEDFVSDCWVAYLEYKENIKTNSMNYWKKVTEYMFVELSKLRTIRNNKYRIESRLSLNQKCGESREEMSSILFPVNGDFTKGVILWDFASGLGPEKSMIMSYMAHGEDDGYIMERMGIALQRYQMLKMELRDDMTEYINS